MKNISEMSLEELQDFALEQKGKIEELTTNNDQLKADYNTLLEDNKALQLRNNRLFAQVESGVEIQTTQEETPPPTCEEFAKSDTLKGVIRK